MTKDKQCVDNKPLKQTDTSKYALLMYKMRPNHDRGRSEFAFTKIDLVSSVAVLLILLFILSPALAMPRHHAARTVCRNNLRQMANASTMYASDNSENMALPNWGSGTAGWLYTDSKGLVPDPTKPEYATNRLGAYQTGLWFDYVRDPNSYMCPIDSESPYYKSRMNKLSSYVMNGSVCGFGSSMAACKITDPWSPECYLLYQPDESLGRPPIGSFAFNDASSYPDRNEGLGALHSASTVDLVTAGGNVRTVTIARVMTEQTATSKSLAWWSPFGANGR